MKKPLYQEYRPKTWDELIGNSQIKTDVELLRRRGIAGRSFWIKGKSGSGKTCVAYLLAREVADEFDLHEVTARELSVEWLEQMYHTHWCLRSITGRGRALVVNEAHGLSKKPAVVEYLLGKMESIANGDWGEFVLIFTTTLTGNDLFEDQFDAVPFASRCHQLKTDYQDASKPFALRCKAIAQAEGLDGKPDEEYIKLARKCHNNFREMLCEIERGAML